MFCDIRHSIVHNMVYSYLNTNTEGNEMTDKRWAPIDAAHQASIDAHDADNEWIESRQNELMQEIEFDDVDDFLCMQADVPTQSRILLEILKIRRDGKELPHGIKEDVDALYAHLECVMWDKAEAELKGR